MFKKFIFSIFILLFSFPVIASDSRIYFVEINFIRGNALFGEISSRIGYPDEVEREELMRGYPFWIEIISSQGEILEKRRFSIDPYINPEPPAEGEVTNISGPLQQEEFIHVLALPYYNNGKMMNLYDANLRLLDTKDIGYLAELCGDNICQDHESYEDCPEDCKKDAKDDYCNLDVEKNDPDCMNFTETSKKNNDISEINSNNKGVIKFVIFITFLIFSFGLIFLGYKIMKRQKD